MDSLVVLHFTVSCVRDSIGSLRKIFSLSLVVGRDKFPCSALHDDYVGHYFLMTFILKCYYVRFKMHNLCLRFVAKH